MSRGTRGALLGALVLVGLAGLLLVNLRYARQHPGGAAFWPLWQGTRGWLLQGTSPYAPPSAGPQPPWAAGRAFDLPPALALLLTPYALVADYALARALWMLTLEVALLATPILAAWALHGPRGPRLALAVAFALLGPWGVAAVVDGRVTALLLPLAVLAAHGWRRGWTWPAALLAQALWARPVLFGPWLLVWALWLFSRSDRRGAALAWAAASGGVFALSSLLVPDWFAAYAQAWLHNRLLDGPVLWGWPHALAQALPGLGGKLGWAVAAVTAGVLLVESLHTARKSWLHAAWTASLALAWVPWLGLPAAPSDTALAALLAGLLVWALWDQRWLYGPRAVVLTAAGGWLLAWLAVRGPGGAFPPHLGLGLSYGWGPLLVGLGLYSVRWWATHADWWAQEP